MDDSRRERTVKLSLFFADAAPVTDLLDVFSTYGGNVLFGGLTEGTGGQPSILGMIGWIFTSFGALLRPVGFRPSHPRGERGGKGR